jgi:hypothetical protein
VVATGGDGWQIEWGVSQGANAVLQMPAALFRPFSSFIIAQKAMKNANEPSSGP